jgi:ribosomal protein S27AE
MGRVLGQGTCTWAVRAAPPEPSVLYRCVQEYLATWLAQCREGHHDGGPVPAYVEREFRRCLECGILAHGFARARCGQCGHDFLIAFSCKSAAYAPRATRAAWWRRQRISPITSCRTCLDGYNLLPYLEGKVPNSPRKEFFSFNDDAELVAFPYGNMKFVYCEQRQPGLLAVWAEPFTCLRAPKMFNLRMDPYERADFDSNTFYD